MFGLQVNRASKLSHPVAFSEPVPARGLDLHFVVSLGLVRAFTDLYSHSPIATGQY